jgi:hypothetical protein
MLITNFTKASTEKKQPSFFHGHDAFFAITLIAESLDLTSTQNIGILPPCSHLFKGQLADA